MRSSALASTSLAIPAGRSARIAAIAAGSFTGTPKRLRIHRITNTEIYSLTCPDGRVTFHLDKLDEGEPLLVWRRIGDHAIDKNP
jgi:hypothetical protein